MSTELDEQFRIMDSLHITSIRHSYLCSYLLIMIFLLIAKEISVATGTICSTTAGAGCIACDARSPSDCHSCMLGLGLTPFVPRSCQACNTNPTCANCTTLQLCTKCVNAIYVPYKNGTAACGLCSPNCANCQTNGPGRCDLCYAGSLLNSSTLQCDATFESRTSYQMSSTSTPQIQPSTNSKPSTVLLSIKSTLEVSTEGDKMIFSHPSPFSIPTISTTVLSPIPTNTCNCQCSTTGNITAIIVNVVLGCFLFASVVIHILVIRHMLLRDKRVGSSDRVMNKGEDVPPDDKPYTTLNSTSTMEETATYEELHIRETVH